MGSIFRTVSLLAAVALLGTVVKLSLDAMHDEPSSTPAAAAPQGRTTAAATAQRSGTIAATPASEPVDDSNVFRHVGPAKASGADGSLSNEAAADLAAAEIVDSLEDAPTLVIWLFDRTASADSQRAAVLHRCDEIYRKLADLQRRGHAAFRHPGGTPLLTVIGQFDRAVELLTPEPTADAEAVHRAIALVRQSAETEEMTFTAIETTLNKFLEHRAGRQRRVMLVVVSDEAGEDADHLEPLVSLARRYAIPIYAIGVPAPLGRGDALSKLFAVENFRPVHQGPESLAPEAISLESFDITHDADLIDSGFGPFGLTRLCLESGGIYFAVRAVDKPGPLDRAESIKRFDPQIMARYAPDYLSPAAYDALLKANKAREALHEAARLPRVQVAANLQLTFVKKDEASLKQALDKAQQTAARLEPKLRPLYAALAAGESDRNQLTGPRWQAGYDLAMGRVLATRARIEGYNTMLAQLKQGRNFPEPSHNTWVLKSTPTFHGDSSLEKLAAQARKYLQRVTREHDGTPWALLAWRELETGLGWEWTSR